MKRLLFVTHHRRYKTAFRSAPLARELVARGYDVTLICIADHERFTLRETHDQGVRFVEAPDLLWGQLRSGWDPWNLFQRSRYLRGKSFDLVHLFETRPATIHPVKNWLKKNPAPLVIDWIDWWGRGGLITELRPRWYQLLFGGMETYYEEKFRVLGDALTVISDGLKERAVGLGVKPDSIHKIHDGAEPAVFTPRDRLLYRDAFNLPKDRPILGYSAADVTMDTGWVLDVLKRVIEKKPETLLLMTGNKPPALDRAVSMLGLDEHVRHLGFLPYEDLPRALSCVDVFLLPFPKKPANLGRWPHKIADYMCLGRPTVTNPVGEMKILFETENVGLLAEENVEDMAAKTIRLLEDQELREKIGQQARRVAEQQFTWSNIVDQLEAVYQRAEETFRQAE